MNSIIARAALIGAALALCACATESVSEPSTPDIQKRELAQLSAGGGIAGYDFFATIDGQYKRVGTLLVIEDAAGGGYAEETEYWRFDPLGLDALEAGEIAAFDVGFVGKRKRYRQWLADHFEDGTGSWVAWTVNRQFNLATDPTVVWNSPDEGHVLYELEGRGWNKGEGRRVTYYLEFDFNIGEAFPGMSWYIDYDDFEAWQTSRGDDDRMYEVRLRRNSVLEQTPYGVGYELKTIK